MVEEDGIAAGDVQDGVGDALLGVDVVLVDAGDFPRVAGDALLVANSKPVDGGDPYLRILTAAKSTPLSSVSGSVSELRGSDARIEAHFSFDFLAFLLLLLRCLCLRLLSFAENGLWNILRTIA